MLIARQKQQENIAEYILYMYQVEDLIRSYSFDIDLIIDNIVRPQIQDEQIIDQYRQWYAAMSKDLKISGAQKKGHMSSLKEVMVELTYLHNTLLTVVNDKKYQEIFEKAKGYIEEFRQKAELDESHFVDIAFQALYMKLLLRLQNKDISKESEEAFDAMRLMIAYLTKYYHKMKSGDLDFLNN